MKKIVLLICFLTFLGCKNTVPITLTGQEGQQIPEFTLLKSDSTIVTSDKYWLPNKPLLLFIFNPHCPYCRAEIGQIIKDKSGFSSHVNVCLVTRFPYKDLVHFYKEFKLMENPNIYIGKEVDDTLIKYFKPTGVPYVAVYNTKSKLQGVFMGFIDFKYIKSEFYSL